MTLPPKPRREPGLSKGACSRLLFRLWVDVVCFSILIFNVQGFYVVHFSMLIRYTFRLTKTEIRKQALHLYHSSLFLPLVGFSIDKKQKFTLN
jgi:hypothetical protein